MSGAGITEPDNVKQRAKAKVERVHREPEIASRAWQPGDPAVPRTAASMAERADRNGWRTIINYALGFTFPTSRTDAKLTHSIALSMVREAQRVVGIWHARDAKPLKWSYNYGVVHGECVLPRIDGTFDRSQLIFAICADELKWLLGGPVIGRPVISDRQYEALGGNSNYISESEFRYLLSTKFREGK